MTTRRDDYVELHQLLVKTLTARLQDNSATAADLNVIRQLLKDSGMDFVEKNYDQLKRLEVPFPSQDSLIEDATTIQ